MGFIADLTTQKIALARIKTTESYRGKKVSYRIELGLAKYTSLSLGRSRGSFRTQKPLYPAIDTKKRRIL